MQVIAKLKHLRMSPRKVRLVANLVKGMDLKQARAQLQFAAKKVAVPLLKLLNSAASNAKHNFNLDENNLYIAKLTVDGGQSLKRWLPRAMGRATPILKRTSSINLVLEEKAGSKASVRSRKKDKDKKEEVTSKPLIEREESIVAAVDEREQKTKPSLVQKPYRSSSVSKKKFFSRQSFGNIKKIFRRKSV